MSRRVIPVKNFLLIILVGLILMPPLAFQFAYLNRIYPGVAVAGLNLGNRNKQEARKNLEKKISSNLPEKLILVGPSKTWEENLVNLGFSYRIDESLENAYKVGRQKSPIVSWRERKTAWSEGVNLPLVYQIDQSLLEKMVNEISQSLFVPTVNPQIKVLEKQFGKDSQRLIIEPGKTGQEVNESALISAIVHQLSYLKTEPIIVPIKETNPQLAETEMEITKIRAEKLLGKNLKLIFEDKAFTLLEKELIDFLSFDGGFDSEKINQYAKNLASNLNRPPENAAFQFSSGRATIFRPSKEGVVIFEEKIIREILDSLETLEKTETNQITLTLEAKKTPPQIKTENVNNLGIKELLGKGVSYFAGSIPSRIHNIVLASSRINGILVAPGEVFSFNKALGEVSQITGFKEAYIIKEGRTILGDGGGVCQVSTTLFRAVLNAGLPVEERRAHAYRVTYYEQSSPPGLDATVFEPSVDFKFKNDTPTYILIQTSVDTKSKTLIFELYGTSDGRIVNISKSRIWDQIPPPPDLYQDDPTLPTGTIKQIDWKAWGAKVAFDWRVERAGEILQKRTFYSVYRPWQAVYLRGIGLAQ